MMRGSDRDAGLPEQLHALNAPAGVLLGQLIDGPVAFLILTDQPHLLDHAALAQHAERAEAVRCGLHDRRVARSYDGVEEYLGIAEGDVEDRPGIAEGRGRVVIAKSLDLARNHRLPWRFGRGFLLRGERRDRRG